MLRESARWAIPERLHPRRAPAGVVGGCLSGAVLLCALALVGSSAPASAQVGDATPETIDDSVPFLLDDDRAADRREMVERYLAPHIQDTAVLAAMGRVPRHRFISNEHSRSAYYNRPLPIGLGQTISQPFVVARMTELLQLTPESRVLEVGTGSGYQTAVLAELVDEVWSIELLEPLGRRAAEVLAKQGYEGIHLRVGDGYVGWPEAAPFDAIIVTCAPEAIPGPLQEQLAEGGRMVIPVGERGAQELVVVEKRDGQLTTTEVLRVRFVPMVDDQGEVHAE